MPGQNLSPATCPDCGTRTEEGFSGRLGRCMICLLRVGFGETEGPNELDLPPASDQFGTYQIEHHDDGALWELGRGAMGVTYRALDTSLRRAVALKLIDSEWVKHGAEARERFMREARTAAALRHPNVATVYHFGIREETGRCFCAMELVEGETLEMRVRRTGPLDALTTIDIALQVSSALAAAEKQGLVHRDLKPANLMFVAAAPDANDSSPGNPEKADTVVKVIDFGVAKALVEKPDAMGLTHGGFVGTPAFASPEQFTDAPVGVRSDIYSLGATLWYLLTGHRPFEGTTIEQIRASQRSQALPIEQLKAARVPSRLISLLVSMLAAEPAARPGVHALTSQLQDCRAHFLDRWKSARRLALAAGLIGIAVAAFVLFPRWHNRAMSQNTARANISEKSIAVLPFENLSRDPDNAFFTDGVQDEILTSLARIAELKVVSRSSAMQYKSGAPRNLREIGQQLGVAHVVEGSVQRAANKVRVIAQLLDARTDTHLWAQTYDRDLADVFAIQSEIAKAIAEQLQAKLSPNEKKAIEQPPTTDLAAFDLYSRAKSLLLTASFSATADADWRKAIELLHEAVKRDPSFFDAYCQLASADSTSALAEAALQAATRLRPDAAETHLARAQYLYDRLGDYDGALAELEIARRALPNGPRLFQLTGGILLSRGQQEEGLRNLERAAELDPRNFNILQQIALTYQRSGRYAESLAAVDRALAIVPDNAETRAFRGELYVCWKADTRPLHQTIDAILAQGPSAIISAADAWFFCALAERDPVAAERALVAVGDNPCWSENVITLSRSFGEGLLARMTKDEARARTAFEAARAQQEKIVQAQPDDGGALCVLGLIDAALGRKDLALDEGRRAIALTPMEKGVSNGSLVLQYFAITAAWAGDKELALQQLEAGLRAPVTSFMLSYGALKLLPVWDPLRGDPRFEQIVASLAPK